MKKRIVSLLLTTMLVTSAIVGCGFTGTSDESEGSSTESEEGGETGVAQEISVSFASDPQQYDPRDMNGVDMKQIATQLFVGLVRRDSNGEFQPAHAENWEVNEDMTLYTFNLNKDVKWSDGEPVTATDYVYSWTSALDPAYISESADNYYSIKGAEKYNKGEGTVEEVGVKAIDDYTLEVAMEYSDPLFLEKVATIEMSPIRQDVVEKYDDPREWSYTPDTHIGNGPFILKEYTPKQSVILTKNEEYYKADDIKLEKIEVVFIEEATTALASFTTDATDITNTIPQVEIERMIEEGTAVASPMLATYYYSINMETIEDPAVKEALAKPEVRQALSLAIDREAIVTKVAKSGQTPSTGIVPNGVLLPDGSNWADQSDYIQPTADLDAAKELLAEAGYPDGEGFPTIQVLYNTNESHQAIAQAVQDMWKQGLGINVELMNKETKVFSEERGQGLFQMARSGNVNGSAIDPEILTLFTTDNIEKAKNEPRYSNPEYDTLIAQATQELDMDKRMEYYRQAEDILMTDMPVIPIYNYTNVAAVKPSIDGFYQTVDGILMFEFMSVTE